VTSFTDQWLTDTLEREGWPTFTDRAADRGGPSKGPITWKTLAAWRASLGRLPPTLDDLKALDEPECRDILRSWYLAPWGFLAYDPLIALCADWSVTSGPDDPARVIQRHLRDDRSLNVAVDGVVGTRTRAAWHLVAPSDYPLVYGLLWRARLRHYVDIVLNERDVRDFMRACPTTQLHNLRGWQNRALSMPATPDAGGGRDPISSDPRSPGAAAPPPPK
jgi:type VI secretion system secreted protein VgrG